MTNQGRSSTENPTFPLFLYVSLQLHNDKCIEYLNIEGI